jgi:hypothetical protein
LNAEVNKTTDYEYSYRMFPIEIEDTFLGNSLSELLDLVLINHQSEEKSLKPYTFVAFRILHRMANILQYEEPGKNYDKFFPDGMEHNLKRFYKKSL